MFTKSFGIEIEFTGITRQKAAETAAGYLGCSASFTGGYYEVYEVRAEDGRIWKFMYDGSLKCQRKETLKIILNEENHPYGTPSTGYLETIMTGYKSAGFDENILHQAANESMKGV